METLSEYLTAENLTYVEFAEEIEAKAPTVQRYATGQRFPEPEYMLRIWEKTNGRVSPNSFYIEYAQRQQLLPKLSFLWKFGGTSLGSVVNGHR